MITPGLHELKLQNRLKETYLVLRTVGLQLTEVFLTGPNLVLHKKLNPQIKSKKGSSLEKLA